jgi:C-terminal binding protein
MNKKQNNVFITDYINNPRIEKEILGDHLCSRPSKEIEYLLVWHRKINKEFLNSFPNLKGIVRYGVGYDNIDLEICKERNIVFCNTPDYGTEEVSNTTISMIMDSSRKVFEYNQIAKKINDNSWQENTINNIRRNNELSVGIIGCGRIGSSVILKLNSLNFNTCFYDPYLNWGYEKVISSNRLYNIDDLLKNCDIVSIHCPLNNETDGMIDSTFLKKMKRGSILINTARGEIISDIDLIYNELKNENMYSVYLDVLPNEPPNLTKKLIKEWRSNSSLSHRIIINPHTAYYSLESFEEMRVKASENIFRMINNEPLLYRIL